MVLLLICNTASVANWRQTNKDYIRQEEARIHEAGHILYHEALEECVGPEWVLPYLLNQLKVLEQRHHAHPQNVDILPKIKMLQYAVLTAIREDISQQDAIPTVLTIWSGWFIVLNDTFILMM